MMRIVWFKTGSNRPLTRAAKFRFANLAPRETVQLSPFRTLCTTITALATADSGMQSNEQQAFYFGYKKIHHVGRMSACSLILQAHFFLCLPVRWIGGGISITCH
jgi:hypothetical protein